MKIALWEEAYERQFKALARGEFVYEEFSQAGHAASFEAVMADLDIERPSALTTSIAKQSSDRDRVELEELRAYIGCGSRSCGAA